MNLNKTEEIIYMTKEEIKETCLKKCGCCIERENGKIECLNPYWCQYDFTPRSGLD